MPVPTFREVEGQLATLLREQGGLGAIVIDLEPLARIERGYGGATYQALRAQIEPAMEDLRSRVRELDLLTRDEREGDKFILFLGGRRGEGGRFVAAELAKLTDRIEEFVTPRVARLAAPYLREKPELAVGYGFVLASPLEGEERQILRAIEDAVESCDLRRRLKDRTLKEGLYETIYNQDVWTAFQPIVEMESRQVMGYEGLSRGPRGSDLESPMALFGLAARYGVVEELERACRRQAFQDWRDFSQRVRLFINTVPATIRDASFLGRGVLDYLGSDLSPRFVTLEITETQIIQNLAMYREAMAPFLDMGFSFAIDDVGAGYSGLETIAHLGVSFLKIDMGLVRDLHQKPLTRPVVKAIIDLGRGMGATVIAEGIQTQEEAEAVRDLGVRYAQGYLFGRPQDPYAAPPSRPR
jgi:EAL domain-containing protein (putative c-di-GMP-specific phosphodiesterase class I)